MGAIRDKLFDEHYENQPDYAPQCKHGTMKVYGCWYCKTEERLDRIEQALDIEGISHHSDGGAE